MARLLRIFGFALAVVAALSLAGCGGLLPKNSAQRSKQSLSQATVEGLRAMGSSPGAGMLIRLYKDTKEFEVWKEVAGGDYKLFKTFEICAYSGGLGPKIKEGDRQSPEGFYNITPGSMNPNSGYYLAFNTGFPNKFDRAWERTGSELMVHGDCSSRGCYSMTDEGIAEIYALARESFAGGNTVIQMQIFPFRMTPRNLALHAGDPNMAFWKEIKEGYDRFELSRRPPSWDVCEKKYVFDLKARDDTPLEAAAACPVRGPDALLTALAAKQKADDAQIKIEVAAIEAERARAAAAQQEAADEAAAVKARGEAIGGFVSGLLGGGTAEAGGAGSSGSAKVAPVPHPAPSWV